jgi:hypothetical protein
MKERLIGYVGLIGPVIDYTVFFQPIEQIEPVA